MLVQTVDAFRECAEEVGGIVFHCHAVEIGGQLCAERIGAVEQLCKCGRADGQICLGYVAWYGLGRMFIEGLRTDSLYIGSTGIRVSQLLAALCFVGALSAMIWLGIRLKNKPLATCMYTPESKHYTQSLEAIARYEETCNAKQKAKEEKRKEKEAARQQK